MPLLRTSPSFSLMNPVTRRYMTPISDNCVMTVRVGVAIYPSCRLAMFHPVIGELLKRNKAYLQFIVDEV